LIVHNLSINNHFLFILQKEVINKQRVKQIFPGALKSVFMFKLYTEVDCP